MKPKRGAESMALRITFGKLGGVKSGGLESGGLELGGLELGGLGFLRPRWGVRGSLFAAFAVIAGMAIIISAGAGMVLGHLGGAIGDLSGQDISRPSGSL